MSTVALTLNKNEVNTIERGVGTITVGTGKLVVVPFGGEPTVVSEGESYEANAQPVTILALEGTNYGAVYTEPTGTEAPVLPREVPAGLVPAAEVQAPRGDTDGDSPTGGSGSYEDRTVAELKATAKKNGVDLEGATTKADIIAKLRD